MTDRAAPPQPDDVARHETVPSRREPLQIAGPCVVTGAGGFIGRRLVARLRQSLPAQTTLVGLTRQDVDMTDGAAVAAALARLQPRTVFHLAASGVAPAANHGAGRGAGHGVGRGATAAAQLAAANVAMAAAVAAGCPPGARLVMAGTMAEYGPPLRVSGRLSESDVCRPTTPYGIAKLAASLTALAAQTTEGRDGHVTVTVARLFGVFGPGEAAHRLLPSVVRGLAAGTPVPLSDGQQLRDFIHVDDACDTLAALAALPEASVVPASAPVRGGPNMSADIVNVGTGHALTVRAACEALADAMGADRALLRFGAVPRRATDEDRLEADTQRLAALTGHVPPQRFAAANLADRLADCIAAYAGTAP